MNRAPHRGVRGAGVIAAALVLALALVLPAPARAQATEAAIPAYEGFVTDAAHVLSEGKRAQLEAFLDQLQTKTGAQFAVLTVPDCAPEDPAAYKVRVFQSWGIGRKGENDGLLLLVAMKERAIRFETGYGLEGTLPDGWQSRMTRNEMIPRFRAGDTEGGIVAGVLASAARIAAAKGVTLEWDGRELRYRTTRKPMPGIVLALVIFLIVAVIVIGMAGGLSGGPPGTTGRRRARRDFDWMGTPGWGGGWSSGGGGWSGGSGGFGGGGSFGGFGGGASGGGGGGGNW